jgi:hypothetical protein
VVVQVCRIAMPLKSFRSSSGDERSITPCSVVELWRARFPLHSGQ